MQEEVGEQNTPHIQGTLAYKNAVALSTLKQWNTRIHWEKTISIQASVAYCTDETKRSGRIWTKNFSSTASAELHLLQEPDLYPWQRDLITELRGPPHPRSVIWYTDREGGCGKTALARLLYATFTGVIYLNGGSFKDAAHAVIRAKQDPRLLILNLPRSVEGKVSYTTLESIKDGLVASGKYEGGVRLYPVPHVIVFSNFFPDINALSQDRWDLRELRDNTRYM